MMSDNDSCIVSLLVHGQRYVQLFLAISSSENGSANLWEVYTR